MRLKRECALAHSFFMQNAIFCVMMKKVHWNDRSKLFFDISSETSQMKTVYRKIDGVKFFYKNVANCKKLLPPPEIDT